MGLDLSGHVRHDKDTDEVTESLSEKENAAKSRSGNGYSESRSIDPSKEAKRRPRMRVVKHVSTDSPDKWSYGNHKQTRNIYSTFCKIQLCAVY
jgi:hypothetical protein